MRRSPARLAGMESRRHAARAFAGRPQAVPETLRTLRPPGATVERRNRIGHWEIDTMMGGSLGESSDCILTLVERKTGFALIGKLKARTAAEANRVLLELLERHPGRVLTITADNGSEFHWYGKVEAVSRVKVYFATPHHSWERGTNENTQ